MNNQNIVEIWGNLDYIGLDAEGNLHIIIKKGKTKIKNQTLKKARELTGERVKITIKNLPRIEQIIKDLPW